VRGAPLRQPSLGIDAPPRAIGGGRSRARLVDARAAAVAVHAARADVDNTRRQNARHFQRREQVGRSRVGITALRRRRAMQERMRAFQL